MPVWPQPSPRNEARPPEAAHSAAACQVIKQLTSVFGLGPFLLLPHVEGEKDNEKMGMFMKPPNENVNICSLYHTL